MEKTPCWILIRRPMRVDEFVCSECRTSFHKPWAYCPTCNAVPHGGYEVFMCRYVPGTGEHVVLKLAAMMQDMMKERG